MNVDATVINVKAGGASACLDDIPGSDNGYQPGRRRESSQIVHTVCAQPP